MVGRKWDVAALRVSEMLMQLDDRKNHRLLLRVRRVCSLPGLYSSSRVTDWVDESWWDLEANSCLQTVWHTTMVAVRR